MVKNLILKNCKKVINNGKDTWFSFFSKEDNQELIELQNNLYEIFKSLIKSQDFTDYLHR